MRNVLIAYATRLGAAHEIADAIARELRSNGDQVRVECLQDAPQVRDAELVVVGSGINAGRFYPEAVAWLNANQPNLESTTVAVFNTCLNAADPGKQDEALGYNASAVELIGAAASATCGSRSRTTSTGRPPAPGRRNSSSCRPPSARGPTREGRTAPIAPGHGASHRLLHQTSTPSTRPLWPRSGLKSSAASRLTRATGSSCRRTPVSRRVSLPRRRG